MTDEPDLASEAVEPDREPSMDKVIRKLTDERGQEKSICPSEAARHLRSENWQPLMGEVRHAAIRLAKAGEIDILRKGKPVDPDNFKGVYRLRRRPSEDTDQS